MAGPAHPGGAQRPGGDPASSARLLCDHAARPGDPETQRAGQGLSISVCPTEALELLINSDVSGSGEESWRF